MTKVDEAVFDTADAAIDAAHERLIADLAIWARDHGCTENRITRLQALYAAVLRHGRASAIAMLESHATSLQ